MECLLLRDLNSFCLGVVLVFLLELVLVEFEFVFFCFVLGFHSINMS